MKKSRTLHPICEKLRAIFAAPVIAYLLLPAPLLAQTTSPVIVAPGNANTRTYTTIDGVAVVDIATPNAAGLSHNRYTNYNVPTAGLVLNNGAPTQFTTPSQLLGSVTSNFNLKPGAAASVILNEVVAPNPSVIAGFTEVAGARADVVIANPYGITVNGGGFLNTDRVTLATAKPVIAADGSLNLLRVADGQLLITGTGLDASNLDYLSLLGRSVRLDGQVNARDLTVAAGPHDYDYASRSVTATAAAGTAPTYAIDSTLLGGMYANRIRLVATEQGVGVRLLGDVAATVDDFTIDASGKVQLSGRAYAERDARLTAAAGIEVSGADASLTAKRDATLAAGSSALALTDASLVAGRNLSLTGASLTDSSASAPTSSNRFAVGNFSVNLTGAASVAGSLYGAGGTLALNAGSATLSGGAGFYSGADATAAARSLSLRATTGDLDLGNAVLYTPTTLALTADLGAIRSANGGSVQSLGDVTLTAATSLTNGAALATNGALTVKAAAGITNSGTLQAAGVVAVSPTAFFANNAGGVVAGQSLGVTAATLTNNGFLQGAQGATLTVSGALTTGANSALITSDAGRDLTVTAASLANAGFLQSTGVARITVTGAATNSGTIATLGSTQGGADGGVVFNASTLNNSGAVQAAGALSVGLSATTGTPLVNSGVLQSAGATTITAGPRIENTATGVILVGTSATLAPASGALTLVNDGRLQAGQNVTLGGATAPVTLTQGASAVLLAGKTLSVPLTTLDNAGILQTGDPLTLNATGAVTNRATGAILTSGSAGQDLAVNAASLANAGSLQSTGALAVKVAGAIDNSGTLLTLATDAGGEGRGISLVGDSFINTGTIQTAAGLDLTVANPSVASVNSGTIAAAGSLSLGVGSSFTNTATGGIVVGGDLTLTRGSAGGFTLTNAGRLQSGGALSLGASGQSVALDNRQGGVVFAGSTLGLVASSLANAGFLQSTGALTLAISGDFTNTADGIVYSTKGADKITATTLTNAGAIQSAGALDLTLSSTLTNSGTIAALGTDVATIGASAMSNSGLLAGGGRLTVTSASMFNNTGAVQAGTDLIFNSKESFANSGSGSLVLAGSELTFTTGTLTNEGTIQGTRALQLTAGAVTNRGTGVILNTSPESPFRFTSATLSNAGTLQSTGLLALNTSSALTNVAGATIIASRDVSLQSGAGGFTVTNAGLVQSGTTLGIGLAAAPVALTNQATGVLFAGTDLTVAASTVDNAGVVQATGGLTITATGALTNAATGKLLNTTAATVALTGGSLTNAGTVQSTGALTLTTPGALTNSGSILTSGNGALTGTAGTLTNSGVVQSGGTLALTTTQLSGTTLTNSGTITATGAATLVTPGTLNNTATGVIAGRSTLAVNAGSSAFTVLNSGVLRAAQAMSLGTSSSRVALTNAAGGVIGGDATFNATASSLANSGTIQSGGAFTVDATSAITNVSGGVMLTTGATPAALVLGGASLANAGTIQSSGALTTTTSGATTNSGTLYTSGTGALAVNAATIDNSGLTASGGTLALTGTAASGTTVTNSGTLYSPGTLTITAPGAFVNSTADAKVVTDGALAINTTKTGDVTNSGYLQSAGTLTIGSNANRGALTNNAGAALVSGGDLTAKLASVANTGTIQSGAALAVDATGAIVNNTAGKILTTTAAALTVTAATLTNAGTLQSSGALTTSTTGATTNSGTVVTLGAGTLTAGASLFTNTGALQSAAALALNGTAFTNGGTILADGALTVALPGTFTNQAAGKVLGATTIAFAPTAAGALDNSGLIQSGGAFSFAATGTRSSFTNQAGGSVLAGGALTAKATTLDNSGVLQSGAALSLDATGALTNAATGTILTAGTAGLGLTLNVASLSNAGGLQSTGALTVTTTGATDNSGSVQTLGVSAGGSAGALAVTAGSTITNSGTVDAAGTATLGAATTFASAGTGIIKSAGDLALSTGTAFTAATGSSIVSAAKLALTGASGFTTTNDGLLQAATAMTLGASAASTALTNSANGKIQAGSLTAYVASVSNSGLLQADTALAVSVANGGTFTNTATGQVLSGDTLSFTTPGASFTIDNSGLLQSGGLATLGGASHLVTLTQRSGGKFVFDSVAATAGVVDNSGTLSIGSGTISASSFTNHGSSAKLVFSDDTATGSLTTSGDVTNEGVIFGAGALNVSAGGKLSVSSTGAISSTGNATLAATGDFTNAGALYTAGKLTVSSGGTFLNDESGTIDTDGNFAATAAVFRNRGQVNIAGTGDIAAAKFENVYTHQPVNKILAGPNIRGGAIGFSPALKTLSVSGETAATKLTDVFIQHLAEDLDTRGYSIWGGLTYVDSDIEWFRTEQFVDSEGNVIDTALISGATAPQIAAGNLTIRGFDSALNSGLISVTGTLTITGNTGSSFTNDALTLTQSKYHARGDSSMSRSSTVPADSSLMGIIQYWTYDYNAWMFGFAPRGIDPLGTTTLFTNGAGIRAGNLIVTNVASLTNIGAPFGPAPVAKTATAASPTTLANAGTARGLFALATTTATTATKATAKSVEGTASAGTVRGAGAVSIGSATAVDAAGYTSGISAVKKGTTFGAPSGPRSAAGSGLVAPPSFAGRNFSNLGIVSPKGSLKLGGLTLKLPTNPNGYFVTNRDPNAKYRVSVNASLGISSDAIGSDFLAKQLGYDPDKIETRLGDPAYETYLVRQQLVDQLGSKFLAGQTSETEQMKTLMTAGAQEARRLGLQWGAEPSPEQLAALDRDIVWMVARIVDGEEVLVPQVYLSSKTKAMFDPSAATIAATGNAVLDVGSLTNTGGDLSAGGTLVVKASGDITNTSGTIKGGNVGLIAGGSITNETVTSDQGKPGEHHDFLQTSIGKTGTIQSDNILVLDAGKDINVKGANIDAKGSAAINAGGDINVSTITKTTATTTSSESKGTFSSSSTRTTVTTVENIGSKINVGGSLSVSSGGDTTLAGSSLDVKGNLKTDIKGDFNVVDVHDTRTVDSRTSKSGVGTGGGIYGSKTTTVHDETSTSKGSTVKVGGNADIKAGGDVTLEGSQLKITGDGSIDATNINVLEGRNTHTNVTVTRTSTFGVFTDSGGSSGANSKGSSKSGSGKGSANAEAGGSADITIGMRTTTDVEKSYDSTVVSSKIDIGGNAKLTAKDTITVSGSDVKADGNLDVKAKDILTLAAQDIHSSNETIDTTTVGLSASAGGNAAAAAQGNGSQNGNGSGRGSGSAAAEGTATVGLKAQTNHTEEGHTTSTAHVSTLTSGGDLTRIATNTITDVGTAIDVGGDLKQSATTIISKAAANTESNTFSSETMTYRTGVGVTANANVGAGGGTEGGGKADQDSSGMVGGRTSLDLASSSSSDSKSTAVVSTIKVKGNVTSTSTDKTSLEGTQIQTTNGDVTLSAKSLTFEAAKNTTSENSSDASASASAMVGVGGGSGGGGVGGKGELGLSGDKSSNSTETAVVGGINSGGKIKITTTDDAKFVGTNLDSTGKTTINAGGNVTFEAARDKESSSEANLDAKVSLDTMKGKNAVGVGIAGGTGNSSSDTAVTSTINAKGGLDISAGKDLKLEGTDINSGGDTSLAAKGKVELVQATSTESSSNTEASLEVGGQSGGKNKKSGSKTKSDIDFNAGFSSESDKSSTADVVNVSSKGNLTIKSGSDTTIQGGNLSSEGKTTIAAGGNLNLTAAEESSSHTGTSLEVSGGKKEKENGDSKSHGGVSGGLDLQNTNTQTGGTITAKNGVDLSSGGNTTLVGTDVSTTKGNVTVTAGGTVTQKDAVSTSTGGGFGVTLGQKDIKTDGTNEREQARPDNAATIVPGAAVGLTNDSTKDTVNLAAGTGGKVVIKENTKPATTPPAAPASGQEKAPAKKIDAAQTETSAAPPAAAKKQAPADTPPKP